MFNDLDLSRAVLTCFDGEGAGAGEGGGGSGTEGGASGAGAGGAGAGAGGAGAGAGGASEGTKTFTQDQVNKILAEDKRKHQSLLQKTEQTYQDLLANSQSLSEKERKTLEENLQTVQGQLRTKEQQLALEKKEVEDRLSKKVVEAEEKGRHWEKRYHEETITRSLQDAAIAGDAFNPSQIVIQLRSMAKLVEDVDKTTGKPTGKFNTVIEFPDVDATTGEQIMTTRTPEDAVKRMKELPQTYGNLFKSNVVSGIGSNSSTAGLSAGSNGKIDVRNLTPQQYREIREKNPELLGLRPRRKR